MKHHNSYSTKFFGCSAAYQRGLSLIELLISMTIGLIILAAGSAVYVSSARGSAVSEQSTRLNEDGVLALNFLQSQIRQAGYYQKLQDGAVSMPPATLPENDQAFYLPPVRGCRGKLGKQAKYMDITCTEATAANSNDTNDTLVVQYEADSSNTYPTANSTLPTNCNGENIKTKYATTAVKGTPEPRYQAINRFYIANKTLMCIGNNEPDKVTKPQPLFPNVEQMVLRYGIAAQPMVRQENEFDSTKHQVEAYAKASELKNDPNWEKNDWNRVRSINICLLVRSQDEVKDAAVASKKYTDCHGKKKDNDGYLRRTFVSTVMLRNRLVSPDQKGAS